MILAGVKHFILSGTTKWIDDFFGGSNCTGCSLGPFNMFLLQVNLFQKLLFLHQLTHNMMTDCSLNYKFNAWKFQAQTRGEHVVNRYWFLTFRTIFVYNMFSPCSAKRRASDKDLPVDQTKNKFVQKNLKLRIFWWIDVTNVSLLLCIKTQFSRIITS